MAKSTKKQRQTVRDPLIARAKKTLKPVKPKKRRASASLSAAVTPAASTVAAAAAAGTGPAIGPQDGRRSPPAQETASAVLDRLYSVVISRRQADPAVSHSARLLSRGIAKVAQKFGEEAVECLIEAVAGNRDALVAESADVLYHLIVVWVASGVSPDDVWDELKRREGISGIAEKAARVKSLPVAFGLETKKIP